MDTPTQERTRWQRMALRDVRVGDVIEFDEWHFGPERVLHLGRSGADLFEVGTDRCGNDIDLPGNCSVRVQLPRPVELAEAV